MDHLFLACAILPIRRSSSTVDLRTTPLSIEATLIYLPTRASMETLVAEVEACSPLSLSNRLTEVIIPTVLVA